MTKQQTIEYVLIIFLMIGLCMGLAYATKHVDSLADRYNHNQKQELVIKNKRSK